MASQTAMLLEIDGVLGDWSDGRWCLRPGATAVLRRMRLAEVPVIGFGQGTCWTGDPSAIVDRQAALHTALATEGEALTAIYVAATAGDGWPKPGLVLRAAQEQSLDLSKSWLISTEPAAMLAAAQAGCLGGVLIGDAPAPKAVLGFTCNQAVDLTDAPRVMVPPQGGCWHDHR